MCVLYRFFEFVFCSSGAIDRIGWVSVSRDMNLSGAGDGDFVGVEGDNGYTDAYSKCCWTNLYNYLWAMRSLHH